jgi:hypothetical protein
MKKIRDKTSGIIWDIIKKEKDYWYCIRLNNGNTKRIKISELGKYESLEKIIT